METCSAGAVIIICLDVSGHPTPFLSAVLPSLTELVMCVHVFQSRTLVCGGCSQVVVLVPGVLKLQRIPRGAH